MYEITVYDETGHPHGLDAADKVKEAFVGEKLTFQANGGSITELASYDPEDSAEFDGPTFKASAPGVYRLRCVATNGIRQILIRVVDRSVLAAIPAAGLVTGQGESAAKRLVLRSLVNHEPNWDGTADMWFDGRVKLSNHGVATLR